MLGYIWLDKDGIIGSKIAFLDMRGISQMTLHCLYMYIYILYMYYMYNIIYIIKGDVRLTFEMYCPVILKYLQKILCLFFLYIEEDKSFII